MFEIVRQRLQKLITFSLADENKSRGEDKESGNCVEGYRNDWWKERIYSTDFCRNQIS